MADPTALTPRIGLSTDYTSNPQLLAVNPLAEEHGALLVDLPASYDSDGVEVVVRPTARLTNSAGYSSLASNYVHLDANTQLASDLNVVSVRANWDRDSSLYHAGELADGIGVRRDTESTGIDWLHTISPLSQLQFDAGWTETRYRAVGSTLVDYRYLTASLTDLWTLSERNTIELAGSFGRYHSLNGISESKSESPQLIYVRQLNEIFTVTASAGYSHALNTEKLFFGPFYIETLDSPQVGGVYGVSLKRTGERSTLTAGVTRALQPTGGAFLSRQDSFLLASTYTASERWDFGLSAQFVRYPGATIQAGNSRYVNAQLAANWHWTEKWTVSFSATRVTQQYGSQSVVVSSNEVALGVYRQFRRMDL